MVVVTLKPRSAPNFEAELHYPMRDDQDIDLLKIPICVAFNSYTVFCGTG